MVYTLRVSEAEEGDAVRRNAAARSAGRKRNVFFLVVIAVNLPEYV